MLSDSTVDRLRFRPNILLETSNLTGFAEFQWIGKVISFGLAEVEVTDLTKRCGMILAAQPDLPEQPEIQNGIEKSRPRIRGLLRTCQIRKYRNRPARRVDFRLVIPRRDGPFCLAVAFRRREAIRNVLRQEPERYGAASAFGHSAIDGVFTYVFLWVRPDPRNGSIVTFAKRSLVAAEIVLGVVLFQAAELAAERQGLRSQHL